MYSHLAHPRSGIPATAEASLKSSFHVAVRPALVSCWISWAYLESQEEEESPGTRSEQWAWGMVQIWFFIKTCCTRRGCAKAQHFPVSSTKWHQPNASLCPTGTNLWCTTPKLLKKAIRKTFCQILWTKNSSFQVIFWRTIWKTDVSPQDHRQRPQDSPPPQ